MHIRQKKLGKSIESLVLICQERFSLHSGFLSDIFNLLVQCYTQQLNMFYLLPKAQLESDKYLKMDPALITY